MTNSQAPEMFKYFILLLAFTTLILLYYYEVALSNISYPNVTPEEKLGDGEFIQKKKERKQHIKNIQHKATTITSVSKQFQHVIKSETTMGPFVGEEDTMICKIPKLDPFDEEMMKAVNSNNGSPKSCMDKSLMKIKTDYNSNLLQVYTYEEYFRQVNCCYFSFKRGRGDMEVVYSEINPTTSEPVCYSLTSNVTNIPNNYEFIGVKCSKNSTPKTIDYQDFFGFIHPKPEVEKRSENLRSKYRTLTPENDPLSVIIFGLDSVSHMNFQRFMPKTRNYMLNKMSAIEFFGRNKVSESTFENVTPTLTGFFTEELSDKLKCWPTHDSYFDKCPFIWKNFSQHGYRTLYGEDSIHRSVYLDSTLNGFRNSIVDYDFRTLIRGIEKYEFTDGCYRHQHAANILAETMTKMSVTFKDKLHFQFQWLSTGNHDNAASAKFDDDPVHEALKYLNEENFLNNTLFILMSDHGMTFGKYVATEQGMLESRMPLLVMTFPKWFETKYNRAIKNLKKNTHRLTTPFDLHATLIELLNTQEISNEKLKIRESEPYSTNRGISLFLPIPLNRTCEDAGIKDHWCICWNKKDIPNPSKHPKLIKAVKFAIESINKKLEVLGNNCLKLSLNRIISGRSLDPSSNKFKNNSGEKYDIIFQVDSPSNAIFQITIKFNKKTDMSLGGPISRINAFKTDGNCILNHKNGTRELQELCYCIVPKP